MKDGIEEKVLRGTAGGRIASQSCEVKCKNCGAVITMPKGDYYGGGSTYSEHHLCPKCHQDVCGSQIVG